MESDEPIVRDEELDQPPRIPENPEEVDPGVYRDFLRKKAPYEHPYRMRFHRLWRKADLFDQSIQWLRESYNIDSTRTTHYSRLEFRRDDPDSIPTPVFNEFSTPIQNEASRLGRPAYKGYVRPEGESPNAKVREGARIAQRALKQTLEDMRWEEQAQRGYKHLPLYGGWALKSYMDFSWEKTTRIPVLSAMQCPSCDFRLANTTLDPFRGGELEMQHPGRVQREMLPEKDLNGAHKLQFTVSHCLACDGHDEEIDGGMDEMGMPMPPQTVKAPGPPPLEPFTPATTPENDELYQKDELGQDFGQDVPLGEWKAKTISTYNLFWSQLGIGCDPAEWDELCEVHVESLDWIRARYKNGEKVKRENSQALLRFHPIAGEREIFFSSVSGAGLFKNHSRVWEYHKKPWMEDGKMNRGRSIVMANDVLLHNGEFLIESKNKPGTYIPRVHYDYVPFELRSGGEELHGVSLSEYIFDAQEAINECMSQTQDARQRMASPKWLALRGHNLNYARSGNAGSIWVHDVDPRAPGVAPREIGSTTISPGVVQEIENMLAYIARSANTQEVEMGNFPPGVTAASAIQIAAEQAGERRRARISRIRDMFMRVWSHGLLLMHELVREPRKYWEQDGEDWHERSWTGLDFSGQTQVRIDPEPEHDTSVSRRENAMAALQNNLIDLTNRKAVLAISKKLDVPDEVFENDNLQLEAAEREFVDFCDIGREPVVDPDLDDNASHYERHGVDCHSEKWRDIEALADWDKALLLLEDWPMQFPAIEPMLMDKIPALELRILAAWKVMLQTRAFAPRDPEPFEKVMRFRAHMAAHKRMAEGAQAAAAAGQQVQAAPGGEETTSGTVPIAPDPRQAMASMPVK